jgi:hypothetical protein
MLYVHLIGLVKENKSIKMQTVSNLLSMCHDCCVKQTEFAAFALMLVTFIASMFTLQPYRFCKQNLRGPIILVGKIIQLSSVNWSNFTSSTLGFYAVPPPPPHLPKHLMGWVLESSLSDTVAHNTVEDPVPAGTG